MSRLNSGNLNLARLGGVLMYRFLLFGEWYWLVGFDLEHLLVDDSTRAHAGLLVAYPAILDFNGLVDSHEPVSNVPGSYLPAGMSPRGYAVFL